MTSPPENHPEKHLDAAESSRVTPVFKTWFQTRFKKTNKNQASKQPDHFSNRSGQPVNLSNSQAQVTTNTAQSGPSRFAAGKRVRVSAVFFDR